MLRVEDVLVVGAGPTGLVLALSLARSGVRPRVIDGRDGIAAQSRALDVQARTLELYGRLGLADRLVERGTRIDEIGVRSRGRTVAAVDVSGFGRGLSPYPFILCCPQDEHEALLVEALAQVGVAVEWRTTLVAADDEGPAVRVTLAGPDGTRSEHRFGYLCGCDGALSTVRRELAVGFSGSTSEQTYFVADVDVAADEDDTADAPATPVRSAQTPTAARGAFSFCLHDDEFVLTVPARRRGTTRLIGLLPSALEGRESPAVDEELRALAERTTGSRPAGVHWFSAYRVSCRLATRFRVGRGFLLGDAGHLHSPLGGQGMNTGIADAVNLAWKLAAVVRGRADPALLDTYEPERRAFARSLVATDRLFGLVAGAGRRQRLARGLVFRRLLPALLRFAPTRDLLCTRIAQIHVGYRSGTLSRGVAGRVRGGDRLPWVHSLAVGDTFAPLRSLDWQVHVHGSAGAELRSACGELGLALHTFAWSRDARRAGYRRDALYLVRPDGYVALAQRSQRTAPLRAFVTGLGLVLLPEPTSAEPPVAAAA